jgi:ribosomal-protein-alanine N-acetyltransferase
MDGFALADNLDFVIREATAADGEAIRSLQSPGAALWDVNMYPCLIAICQNRVAAFLFWREVDPGEREIFYLATQPAFRRRGIAVALVRRFLTNCTGAVFLEVRESNHAARKLYQLAGFQEVGRREAYYESPPETAIVMKFHSC